ncbi:MAG TPA: TRAM domain-containing protein [Anaeromyxobacteraceae bacterium]|nr:TRAM domain-containing protein [Anaeromyxobacteraceae bacterium]
MTVELAIGDLAPGGEGVGRDGARPVFVPFAVPGDRVEVEVSAGKGPARGELRRLLEAGPDRVQPPCRHFGPGEGPDRMCGGCEWLHLRYGAQLRQKARALGETLRRIGWLEPGSFELRPVVPSPAPLCYRSRAKFHLDRRSGRLCFFRRRSHEPVRLAECHLLERELDALREVAGPALAEAGLPAQEVTLEWSACDGRGAAALSLPAISPAAVERTERLLSALPSLAGAVLLAEGAAPRLLGDPVLRHQRWPAEPGRGLSRSRPDVFRQANRRANALLVEAALDLLRPDGEAVLELFCGAGNFTGPLLDRAASVAAVEAQGPALDLARRDLEGARPGRLRFFAGDALALARALAREAGAGQARFGAALLDPPREGAKGIGQALRDLCVPRAVYVSCDPATLARDLRGCVEAGYRVAAVQPVDMFPQTHHVEAVALLERP